MYKIIGADQKEYGPVSAEELRQWIREGRANAQSRVLAEGSADWRPLGVFPEFAAELGTIRPSLPTPAAFAPTPSPRKTNGMAVAGLVFGLLGFPCCSIGLFSLLGLIFSLVGLSQIRRNPSQGGRNIAIAGVIISLFALLLSIAVWVAFFFVGISQNQNFNL